MELRGDLVKMNEVLLVPLTKVLKKLQHSGGGGDMEISLRLKQDNNMSNSISSDWFSSVDKSSCASDVQSLLVVISEIMKLSIITENENFITIGCYFYRVASVITELESSETTTNPAETLLSLSECIYSAKSLLSKCNTKPISAIIKQLEILIRQMSKVLKSIKSSSRNYFHFAVQSLVQDINGFSLEEASESDMLGNSYVNENDLYSINDFGNSTDDETETSHVTNFQSKEPLYEAFFCPLTNKIMDDPVTVETGVTYERAAITEWFAKFSNPADIVCPKTGKKIKTQVFNRNIALRETINQWEERNEQASIKAARSALSLLSSKLVILEALHNLQNLCRKKIYNVVEIRTAGIIPLLGTILKHEDGDVKCETLELLRQLTENDDEDEGKEMIARTVDLSGIIQSLSSQVECIRHSALLLLVEISKGQYFCDKISSVTGGVLMLITLKYRQPVDAFASQKVDEILKNLEKSPSNIKIMAENGHWQPLLHLFLEGNDEIKMEMASHIGEIFLGNDDEIKAYVAETALPGLIQMVTDGNSLARNVAFRALKQISSHRENGKILVKSGTISNMYNEIFKRTIYDEPTNSKAEAAGILANILESGSVVLNDLQVDHKMSLDYIIYNIVKRVGNSMPDELNVNFVRILLCLMRFPKTKETIVSVVKENDACASITELLNNPNEELQVVALVFCIALSPFLGHTLADKLCKTRGQPQALLQDLPETTPPTEKQTVSVTFLAKLPHENITLNLALMNMIPLILRKMDQVQKSGTRMSKYGSTYFEGLVGILVRFTATLYENQFLILAKNFSFTTVFTELLMNTSSDEVQRLSANGLENLSLKTVTLSKPAQIKRPKFRKFSFLQKCCSFDSRNNFEIAPLCPVHKGSCSSQETFCLLEAKAVEKLLTCLDHRNVQVVEAALSAICTLLHERVDLDSSEGDDKSTSEISQDRFLRATLINVLHYGNGDIRPILICFLTGRQHNPESHYRMASFSMEDFVGTGSLQKLLPKLLDDGWDDVPTLKIMNSEDMSAINMTQQQKDALEIRSYLHDRSLMQYADKLEVSGKCLAELLNLASSDLSAQFTMKRGHIARFMDRTTQCETDPIPASFSLPSRKPMIPPSRNSSMFKSTQSISTRPKLQAMSTRSTINYDATIEQSMADFKIKDGYVFKGVVAALPDEPRACGCIQPPPIVEDVAPYSSIENISVQKLTPEYKIGMERLVKIKTPPMRVSDMWRDKPALLLCIRRPGCIMCRAEAHKLYSKKPIFDSLGINLFAVLHEHIESEVRDFWPRYWGGVVLLDKNMDFFKALGGGSLLKDKFISGFLFNPRARANYKRAKDMGIEQNFKGEGEIKGGLFVMGKGRSGVAYQFIERNFGDWAPLSEIIEIGTRLKNQELDNEYSITSRDYE
ncbi:putative U-box domain-containing protein 42 [Tanacetum coccineum]